MNNKIKTLLIIGVLALVALTSSCKSDNKAPKGEQTAETYQGKPGSFTIRFSVPSGDPVKYDLRMIQDKREYSIDKVTLYIFENDKLALNPIVINTPDLQQDAQDPTAMSYTYTSTDNSIPQGLVDIYAVANEELTTQLVKGDNVGKLRNLKATRVQRASESSRDVVNGNGTDGSSDKIPMVGIKQDVLLFKQNVVLPLERIVARIDIKNNVANDQLKINEITLQGVNATSNLLPGSSYSNEVSGVKPFLFDQGAARMEHKKVFYLYEKKLSDTDKQKVCTYVVINATFRGEEKEYKIPFYDAAKDRGIDIVRNTLYRIVLGTDHSKYNLTFKLEVADWDGPINTVVNWDAITVAFDSANSNGFTYDATKHELKAPNQAGTATFTTSHNLGTAPTFTAQVENAANSWLKATVESGKVKIQTLSATTTPRYGRVTIACADPKYQYEILVRQDK